MRGVPFGAVDGKPTRLFFLLVAPTVTLHLQIVARLTRVLRNATLRRNLLKADAPEKVIECLRAVETGLNS